MVLDAGFAYQAGGAVYFEVARSADFGSISHYSRDEMLAYAAERGGNPDDPNKRDPLDFVLWQPSLADEPAWDSLWGPGRPGWHIECSALCLRELGTTIDLHGGGADLIYPHHECEAAQSQAATGEPLVRHWMHQAMVRMDGEKMSKSLGNLVFVSELSKDWDPRAIRLACVSHHYRQGWEWNDTVMPEATERLHRWHAAGDGSAALDAGAGGARRRPGHAIGRRGDRRVRGQGRRRVRGGGPPRRSARHRGAVALLSSLLALAADGPTLAGAPTTSHRCPNADRCPLLIGDPTLMRI